MRVALLPGDGIGPEVVEAAVRVLEVVAPDLEYETHLVGGAAIDATGAPLPDQTREACLSADAVLLGAVGGPKWSDPRAPVRPEQGLLALRAALGVYANLRPVRVIEALAARSPLRPERVLGVDFLVVRELTGGIYFGSPRGRDEDTGELRAFDTMVYSRSEIARVVELACRFAEGRRHHLTSVDKANVLESSRLWRETTEAVCAHHPSVHLEHQLVDSCAMRLLTHARDFDVIVTANLFGDILTDEAAALTGSLGVLPSASIGDGPRGLYEPIHGSAPDIAGKGVANPVGTIASAALMLRHSLGRPEAASAIELAIDRALGRGALGPDLGGELGTAAITDAILDALE
ncbi:MAG: 3-isopropylmalate dehydrogenase [Sandaracinaceae bacterium]|nr:3-isopropylmalate dehydrogenase [Sandaracinaceae bacterium]